MLRAVLAARGATIGSRELSKGVSELLPALVERAGESNSRLKDAALEAVRQLAALPEAGLKHMTTVIVKCASPRNVLYARNLHNFIINHDVNAAVNIRKVRLGGKRGGRVLWAFVEGPSLILRQALPPL